MSQQTTLSIIIPVYNAELYLRRCLDSIINQVKDIPSEIILVNDGSRDGSLNICQGYADQYSFVKVFSQENQGQSSARNVALGVARGRYVAFVDSDDSLKYDTLTSAVEYLENTLTCDFVQIPVLLNADHSSEVFICSEKAKVSGERNIINAFTQNSLITWRVCDKVFRRELLEGLRFVEGLVYEDNLYMCEVIIRSKEVYLSDQGCYNYYWNNESTTHSPTAQSFIDMCDVHCQMYDILRSHGASKAALAHILYIISNDMFASYRVHKKNNPVTLRGAQVLKKAKTLDFLFVNTLDIRKRTKMLGMKLLAHIKGW